MSTLRSAVYVAPPIPIPGFPGAVWSPISCTLIYSETEMVLVDTPITVQQTNALLDWIQDIAPKRQLRYIYVTHGHGDHWFGIPIILQRFPEAVPLATLGTVKHMEQQIEEKYFKEIWESRFPNDIPKPFKLATPIPDEWNLKFKLGDTWHFQVVECGHSDTHDSTVLWVPQLKLAVCGDVIYGQVHQMLMEANTKAKREEWLRAIDRVEALNPSYVVPGHKRAEEIDGVWHIESTRKYIQDFGEVLASDPKNEKEIFDKMCKIYPYRFNPGALILSSQGAFMVPKHSRI
ncbi:hypothetical protein AYO21_12118 [Fonsecaea monophora]|uniref:Metallo-beta-lactamase domain-containing protein n=1 Tax=Fonsecaea monophora TaxID=254056 RepID=A0A177EPC8_9EURO|nr:hypothetical protein AYO21_12118 [Fonsecaea monophora]OAG33788.1 hypothetical protein AYO21_12118 [Fonsecaea monophora]